MLQSALFLQSNKKNQEEIHKNIVMVAGLWIDGDLYWLKDDWEKLLGKERLTIKVKKPDLHSEVELYDIILYNHALNKKSLKIIFSFQMNYQCTNQFAFVAPEQNCIYKICDDKKFLINSSEHNISNNLTTVLPLWNFQANEFWQCLETGKIHYQPTVSGPVVSLIVKSIELQPKESFKTHCWSILTKDYEKLLNLNEAVKKYTSIYS